MVFSRVTGWLKVPMVTVVDAVVPPQPDSRNNTRVKATIFEIKFLPCMVTFLD